MSKTIIVCGSRTWKDRQIIKDVLLQAEATKIVDGAAKGADSLAHSVALELGLETQRFPITQAEWSLYGKAAGPMRNAKMLEQSKPDAVIAFWDGHSSGTQHMIRISREAGVEVQVILPKDDLVNLK